MSWLSDGLAGMIAIDETFELYMRRNKSGRDRC